MFPSLLRHLLHAGLAGIVHLCWRARALAVRDSDVAAELSAEELSQVAQTLTAAALASAGRTPRRHHGWSLPLGHAGAYCMAALSYHEAAKAAELAGGETTAAALRRSSQESAKHYSELSSLAASAAEDEFLYGRQVGWLQQCSVCMRSARTARPVLTMLSACRAGWLFGGLLLNKHLGIGAVPEAMLRHVVETVLQSGEHCMAAFPTKMRVAQDSSGSTHKLRCRPQSGQFVRPADAPLLLLALQALSGGSARHAG